jgi:hypothetical protein
MSSVVETSLALAETVRDSSTTLGMTDGKARPLVAPWLSDGGRKRRVMRRPMCGRGPRDVEALEIDVHSLARDS